MSEDILLRLATASFQELFAVRKELSALSDKVSRIDAAVSGSQATSSSDPVAAPQQAGQRGKAALAQLCLVEEGPLRDTLLSLCSAGTLCVELGVLRKKLSAAADVNPGELSEALLRDWRQGNLAVLAFCPSSSSGLKDGDLLVASGDVAEIEATIRQQCTAATSTNVSMSQLDAVVMVSPVFRELCFELVDVVMNWCASERLTVTLDVLANGLRHVVKDKKLSGLSDLDLLAVLPIRQPGFSMSCGDGFTQVTLTNGAQKGFSHPLPLYSAGQDKAMRVQCGDTSNEDAKQLCGMLDAMVQRPAFLRFVSEGTQRWGMIVVTEVLRVQRASVALQLPPVCGGSVAWAMAAARGVHSSVHGVIQHSSLDTHSFPPATSAMQAHQPMPVGSNQSKLQFTASATLEVQDQTLPVGQPVPIPIGGDEASCDDSGDEEGQELGLETEDAVRARPTLEAQAAFISCFREELAGDRSLLLSQLNNLYKMRSGEELPYKDCGYERLRDFLLDIPGLALLGRGNRLQVKVSNAELFQQFKDTSERVLAGGTGAPRFQMPTPPPPMLQQKIKELFLAAPDNEVPLRKFVNMWHTSFPTEQLAYRSLGYRDLRGLLSSIPFIEKVGGKSDAKYVLKHASLSQQELASLSSHATALDPASGLASSASRLACPAPVVPGPVRPGQLPQQPCGLPCGGVHSGTLPLPVMGTAAQAHGRGCAGLTGAPHNPAGLVVPSSVLSPGGPSLMTPSPAAPGLAANAQSAAPARVPDPSWFGSGQLHGVGQPIAALPEVLEAAVGEVKPVKSVLEEPDDLPGFDFSNPHVQSFVALADREVVSRRQNDKQRKKMVPSYFVSSPAAVSSDTRDASTHQGKFDLPSILQTHLLRDVPCLVCDISSGQVMVANSKCDDLFQSHTASSQLTETDIFSLVHPDDRDDFSTHVAYLSLSERTRMDEHHLRIVTLTGVSRHVCMAGTQLIGMWWQFNFKCTDA
mmetsp:Transcript_55852/g.103375  ORF Transcript_55852/g.103375 Transcript_55852/m.103375 type:complete len:977 (-) Transcript_55852:126-3056(-)